MQWIDKLMTRFGPKKRRKAASPTEEEIRGLLERIGESSAMLLRELEVSPDCPDDEAFSRFLSGQCNRREKKRMLDHFLNCHACLASLDDVTREARMNARRENPEPVHLVRPVRSGRAWGWGLGFGVPVAALCVVLAVMLSGPPVHMQLVMTGNAVRSEGAPYVSQGALLHRGDRFRVELSGRKDGYFFLYSWNQAVGGKFVFPLPGFQDDNRVRKGQVLDVPDKEGWLLEDTVPGVETIYLLFSRRDIDSNTVSRLEDDLKKVGRDRLRVENLLKENFSIEQRLSYHVE